MALVVTSYNVVVALVALALVRLGRRIDPARLTRYGLVVFAGASLACAFAPSLAALVAFRSLQGLGGAALLAGSLPLVRSLARDPEHGAARWALAGAFGAALGPAAGGALTEAFDWRAIFLAQAPIAAVALLAAFGRRVVPEQVASCNLGGRLRTLGANAALALLSGALVGALFLVVVLLIDVWGYSPLRAAFVVSAIPAATLLARLARTRASTAAGSLFLAGGLAALAVVPGPQEVWVVAALGLCGFGLGLAVPDLTRGAGTWSVASRHVGLVVALVLLTPLLAHDLSTATTRAEQTGTALVLDAPIDIGTKAPLASELARGIAHAPNGELPDLGRAFAARESSPGVRALEQSLADRIRAVVAHAFRRAFLLSALLALLVAVPLALRPRRALVPAAAAAAALLVAELGAGGLSYGRVTERNPCHPPATVSGSGLDRTAQRFVLRGVDHLACQVGSSRERLVLDTADRADRARSWVKSVLG